MKTAQRTWIDFRNFAVSVLAQGLCCEFVASLQRFNSALLGRCQKINRLLVAQRSTTIWVKIKSKNQIRGCSAINLVFE